MKFSTILLCVFSFLVSIVLFAMTVKGDKGTPIYFQTEYNTRVGGPFESSNSTSRFSLTKAIVENNTFFLDEKMARFSAPDVVYYKNKFFSIFTPGVSFIAIPFYMIGAQLGVPQLFSFFSVTLFALFNIYLIAILTYKLTKSLPISIACGLVFSFATNALPFAHTLTQHHMSTTVILLGFLNALSKRTFLNNITFGILVGIGALIDVPNVFLLAPIGVYILYKHFQGEEVEGKIKLSFKMSAIGLLIGVTPFVAGFAFYNMQTAGSYTKLAQSIGQSNYFDSEEKKKLDTRKVDDGKEFNLHLPFNTRKQVAGFYTMMLSNERAWLFYSPVVLLGIVGLIVAYRQKTLQLMSVLATSVIVMNILLYSMFGDPWGGWSFGPRYLIPSGAILCAFLGLAIIRFRRSLIFLISFLLLLAYSIGITTIGAMSTSAIPPKIEAINLATPIPYTYEYNLQYLSLDKSSSLIYNVFASSYMPVSAYVSIFYTINLAVIMAMMLIGIMSYKERQIKHES